MTVYKKTCDELRRSPKKWLVTGCAGFIGSNILETLLKLDQKVVGLDNFSTGYRYNLEQVESLVDQKQWARFKFIEGDIRDFDTSSRACDGVDYVSHQAAIGSVPRSIDEPVFSHDNNLSGTLHMLVAAKDAGVKGMVYASSSSGQVYNIANGERTTLNMLFGLIKDLVAEQYTDASGIEPKYRDFRAGDVRHSLADIGKAESCWDMLL